MLSCIIHENGICLQIHIRIEVAFVIVVSVNLNGSLLDLNCF